jgi:hypothetical protein
MDLGSRWTCRTTGATWQGTLSGRSPGPREIKTTPQGRIGIVAHTAGDLAVQESESAPNVREAGIVEPRGTSQ